MSYKSVLSNPTEGSAASPGSPSTKGGSSLHTSLYGSSSWTADPNPPPPPADTTPSIYPPAKAPAASGGNSAIPIPQLTSVVSSGEAQPAQDSSFTYGGFDPSSTGSAFQTTEDQVSVRGSRLFGLDPFYNFV